MADPSLDRALGAIDGRVAALERWMNGFSDRLDDASQSNHELATQVALMRQSMDSLSEAASAIKGMRDEMAQLRGAGRLAVGIVLAVGGLGGTIVGSVGAAWIRKLMGWE